MYLTYLSDGKHIVTAGRSICLWDASSGKLIRQMDSNYGLAFRVAVSPDGKTLAAGGTMPGGLGEKVVRLFEIATGKETRTLETKEFLPLPIEFSIDGKTLTTFAREGSWQVWDVASGKQIQKPVDASKVEKRKWFENGPRPENGWTIVSPDLRISASRAEDGEIRVIELPSKKVRSRFKTPKWSGTCMVISADNRYLAAADNSYRVEGGAKVLVWRLETGELAHELKAGHGISAIAFSPDMKTVAAVGADCTLRVWDMATGRAAGINDGHTDAILDVAFSRDSRTVVSAGADGTIRRWNLASAKETGQFATPPFGQMVDGRALSFDGGLFAHALGPKVWDATTGNKLDRFPDIEPFGFATAFSRDGKKLAVGGKAMKVFDVESGKEIADVDLGLIPAYIAFSPDNHLMAISIQANAARFYWGILVVDKSGKVVSSFAGAKGLPNSVAFSPDGKFVASGFGDPKVDSPGFAFWNVATGEKTRTVGGQQGVGRVVFSPDGSIIAAAAGPFAILWDYKTGKEFARLYGHRGDVLALAFSHDGAHLATASADTTVLIWSVGKIGAKSQ